MIIKWVEIYICDYCNKMYRRKWHCENHIKQCKKAPDYIRPCHSCIILKKQIETIWAGYGDMYGQEVERRVEVLFCEKRDCFIHPPSVAAKGNAFEMDKPNIEMPKKCDFYEELNNKY